MTTINARARWLRYVMRRMLRRLTCRHEIYLSDYLPVSDEHGARYVLDRCSRCGKRESARENSAWT